MRVRLRCANCNGTGTELRQERGFFTCLPCGGRGYHESWLDVDDLIDVLAWRERRNPPVKGGA